MPYICILISLVFENVIFKYINTQVVLQFIFKSIYSHTFKHILLSYYYMPGTMGMQWARDLKGGKSKEMSNRSYNFYKSFFQILSLTVPFLFVLHTSADTQMMRMLFGAHSSDSIWILRWGGAGRSQCHRSISLCALVSIVGPVKPLGHWGLGSGSLPRTSVQSECPLTLSNISSCPEVVGKMEGSSRKWRKLKWVVGCPTWP